MGAASRPPLGLPLAPLSSEFHGLAAGLRDKALKLPREELAVTLMCVGERDTDVQAALD